MFEIWIDCKVLGDSSTWEIPSVRGGRKWEILALSGSAKRLNIDKVKSENQDGADRFEISYMEQMLYNIKSLQVE